MIRPAFEWDTRNALTQKGSSILAENFDVIVVGARCAGSPLAAVLAMKGMRVCVLDRARFPSDVPSTHMIQPSGVARLERLGVLERVFAAGTPPLDRGSFVMDDVSLEMGTEITQRFGAPWLCVRRVTLDALLIEAAQEAGARVLTQTPVIGLIEDGGVVRGVRTKTGSLRAPVVVGADGPSSTVARLVGAREYHVTPPGRLFLWAYFENAAEPHGKFRGGKIGDTFFLGMPTDNGLFLAAVGPSMAMRDTCLGDVEKGFAEGLAQVDELSEVLGPAKRVGPIRVMARWHGYFRESAGPGWALVGDAGHFKDPTPAQGITDALRQSEQLAVAIETGLGDGDLARQLDAWWRWRDDDAWDMYCFANFIGSPGPSPSIVIESFRDLRREPDAAEQFMRVLNHDISPSSLVSVRRGLRTIVRVAATHPRRLPRLVSEIGTVVTEQARLRRHRRRPIFANVSDVND